MASRRSWLTYLDRNFDDAGSVSEHVAPYAVRFGFHKGDGAAILDYLLGCANYRNREEMVATAGRE